MVRSVLQTHGRLDIKLIVNDYAQVSGLSRYATALYCQLKQWPDANVTPVPLTPPPLPRPLLRLASGLGYDIGTFLTTYPLSWPGDLGDLVHLTHRAQATLLLRRPSCPSVVTVHDVIHYQYRNDPSMRTYRNHLVQWMDRISIRALHSADAIIASSEYTKHALVREVGLPEAKVHCIHLGVDAEQFRPCRIPQGFLERYSLDRGIPYILHISTEEPRKNLPALIRAFALVRTWHPDARLLKVGWPLYPAVRSKVSSLVDELNLGDSIILVNEVPDEDLVYFYNLAQVFAFPSHAEGFGLPVLEAMACGTPVMCSDRASLPELVGSAALMVAPDDVPGMAEAICKILEDKAMWHTLRESGLERAALFSWTQTARDTLDLYTATMESVRAS